MTAQRWPGPETLEEFRRVRGAKASGVRPMMRSAQRILLVDARSDAQAFMAYALRRHGHAVILADSIETAILAARTQSFHIIVTNVVLTDGSGMTLLKRLQETQPIRGIALCDGDTDDRVIHGAGFELKLQKPVPVAALTNAVLALGCR
jgi:DNA-binding response OmpR family regulator